MNIYIDTTNRANASSLGGPANISEIPLFPYKAAVPVTIYLRDELNEVSELMGAGWIADFAVSTTPDETDTPEILVLSGDITIDTELQTLTFLADCYTTEFQTAVTGQDEPVDAYYGLRLYAPAETQPRHSFRIPCRLDNIVYDDSADPPEEPLSDYYTKTESDALLAGKADSETLRSDIGRALVDGDNVFVGSGTVAACSRFYTYIAAKLAAAYGLLSTAQKATLTGGGNADTLHSHQAAATVAVVGATAGNLYAQTSGSWALFDEAIHAGNRMGYCGVNGIVTVFGQVTANNPSIEPMTAGGPLFAGSTAGSLTATAPTTGQTCTVGWAISETEIFVQPYIAWGGDEESTAS